MEKTTLSVLVPVYNEEYLVEESLKRLFVLEQCQHLENVQVIVVNDGSTDNTGNILNRLSEEFNGMSEKIEWKFIEHETNKGKGKAVQSALQVATGEISIMHDADLEYYPEDIIRMIPLFINQNADVVFGSRFTPHEFRKVLLFKHELGNRLLTFLSNLISDLNLTDMETCYKAVKTSLLKSIPIRSNDFRMEPELTIKLAKRKAIIYEIPINYSGRTIDEGKKINWKDGIKAIWAIIRFGFTEDIFVEDEFGSNILARLSRAEKFNTWLAETIKPYMGQNVLEIGAGIGNLTKKLLPRKQYCVSDINPYYLDIIDKLKFGKPYLTSSYLDLNDISTFHFNDRSFDTIICINVIEHLDDDESAMKNTADLLEKNGRAIVLVPRGQWNFGTLDKVLGHKRRYSAEMLETLAEKAELKISHLLPFNRISTIPWLLNGKIFNRTTFSFFQIFIMNWLTPVFKRIDNLLPVPSLSYIAVLEHQKNISHQR